MIILGKMGLAKNFDCIKVVEVGSGGFLQMDLVYRKFGKDDYAIGN